jgi:hypothetical protein
MTTRAQLQSKSIEELKQIAEAVGVEADGLQKSKLISALMEAGGVSEDESAHPDVELPRATPRAERPDGDSTDSDSSDGSGPRQDGGGQRRERNRNRNRRREDEIPEGDLEVREGLLDILPEGYGFLRVTGYCRATKTSTSRPTRCASSVCARATSSPARSGRRAPRRSSRRRPHRQGQRDGPRRGDEPAQVREPHAAVPRSAASSRGRGQAEQHPHPDRRPDRPDRQGPARSDRLPAEGG